MKVCYGDSIHEILWDANVCGNGELHRFTNKDGVPYSAIYIGGFEVCSAPRENEKVMINYWNNMQREDERNG